MAVRAQTQMALPRASLSLLDAESLAEGPLPKLDGAVIDAGMPTREAVDALRLLRARGFGGPIVVIAEAPDETMLQDAARSLGAAIVSRRSVERTPLELATALAQAASGNAAMAAEVAYARRVFAAGQVALSLQHSINNPLAALLAEAQLLQLEELSSEQRGSVDRMVELCRRVVALVRRLDALAATD